MVTYESNAITPNLVSQKPNQRFNATLRQKSLFYQLLLDGTSDDNISFIEIFRTRVDGQAKQISKQIKNC